MQRSAICVSVARPLRFGLSPLDVAAAGQHREADVSFVEMRRYRLKVGAPERWVKEYFDKGYEAQRKYLGEPVGYYTTEFGGINEIIHMWRYDTLEERAEKRKALFEDPEWLEFVKEIAPLVETQENSILRDIFEA